MMSYLLLHPQDLDGLVTMADAIDAIERAYAGAAEFPIINAPRRRIHSPASVRFNTFPGGIHDLGVIGLASHAEVVTQDGPIQHFGNREHQICLLHDSNDSHLLAIIIGAINENELGYTTQTALRTGATSGVGFRHLARRDAKVVALFGAGNQAVTQLLALKSVRGIEKVRLHTRTRDSRLRFAQTYGPKFGLEIIPVDDPREAVRGADVVVCATNTNVPVLKGEWLEPGQHVTSIVGSNIQLVRAGWLDRPRREVDDRVVERADAIAVNSREAVVQDEQGDLFEPIGRGIIAFDDLAELGEIVLGRRPGRTADDQITLHKNNAGMGIADLAIATCAYRRAIAAGRGTMMDLPPVTGDAE
jgi:ornithine cyclodeaminase/alanine dehydrogenase-like protein (mu-crystallin family)